MPVASVTLLSPATHSTQLASTNALALGAAFPAACGDTSPWASHMKEAEPGFVSAKTVKALSFSSIPVQLAFCFHVRKHLVVICFGKTHFIPGMENGCVASYEGKKAMLNLGALPECRGHFQLV